MEENSIKYMVSTYLKNYMEGIVISLKLKNVPRIFQSRMDNDFKHLNDFLVCVDDILLSSNTLNEHRKHLNVFIEATIKEGISTLVKGKLLLKKEN